MVPIPDFTGTDDYNVVLTLHGQIQDLRFLQFLEKVGRETLASFGTHDFLALDLIHREQPVPHDLRSNVQKLLELGVIERVGRGRGLDLGGASAGFTVIEQGGRCNGCFEN